MSHWEPQFQTLRENPVRVIDGAKKSYAVLKTALFVNSKIVKNVRVPFLWLC